MKEYRIITKTDCNIERIINANTKDEAIRKLRIGACAKLKHVNPRNEEITQVIEEGTMGKYKLVEKGSYYAEYEVEANDEADAMSKFYKGEYTVIRNTIYEEPEDAKTI